MYKYQKLIFFLTLFASGFNHSQAYSQTEVASQDTLKNVIGKFNSPKQEENKFTSETITLNPDTTFEYTISTEFTKIKANGYWRVAGNNLILNSSDKREKINVEEKKSRNDKVKFDVTYKTNEPLYYQLYVITSKDTLHIEDVFGDTVINHTALKGFYIVDTRGFRYPTYFLKKRKSNYFRVRLEKDRIFDNEVWQIKDSGDKLQPIGLNGNLMNYCLIKQ
jgi:hypothetical protein